MRKLTEAEAAKVLQAIIDQDEMRIKKAVKDGNSVKAFRLKRELNKIKKLYSTPQQTKAE